MRLGRQRAADSGNHGDLTPPLTSSDEGLAASDGVDRLEAASILDTSPTAAPAPTAAVTVPVGSILDGHRGVIFKLRYFRNAACLCSVSDDRLVDGRGVFTTKGSAQPTISAGVTKANRGTPKQT